MSAVQNNPMALAGMNFVWPLPAAPNQPAQQAAAQVPAQPVAQSQVAVQPQVAAPPQPLLNLRGRLLAQLNAITTQLTNAALNDQKTQDITLWRDNFRRALDIGANRINPQNVLDQFIRLMQELLDTQDENSVLGSDGIAYGRMNLAVLLSERAPLYRNRSPSRPNDPAPFTTQPHPIVRYMVQWLRGHQAWHANKEIVERYEQLQNQNNVPQIPVAPPPQNPLLARLQRIRAAAERNAAEDAQRNAQQVQEINAQVNVHVNQFVQNAQNISQAAQQNFEQQNARLDNMRQNFDQRINNLNNQAQQLENDIARIDEQNQKLNQDLVQLQGNISQAEREDRQLQILINETEKEIKKNKNKWIKEVAIAAAIVGVCLFATWALPALGSGGAASGAGAKLMVAPTAKGSGIGITAILPL